MHQVRLAKADTAIEKQRVERRRRRLGNAARSGIGELVRLADDKVVEGEAGIERCRDAAWHVRSHDLRAHGMRSHNMRSHCRRWAKCRRRGGNRGLGKTE